MLGIISLILPSVTKVLDKIIPDADARAVAQEEITKAIIERQGDVDKAIAEAAKAQAEVNLKEAENPSLFVSGWRPFIGWVCGIGCAYGFILQPFLAWISAAAGIGAPPTLDMGTLLSLLGGMLGLGTLRTVEKIQGVERQALTKPSKI